MAIGHDVQRSLGRIEGRLELLLEGFEDYKKQQASDHKEIENRVTGIEHKLIYAGAVLAVLAFVFNLISGYLLNLAGINV